MNRKAVALCCAIGIAGLGFAYASVGSIMAVSLDSTMVYDPVTTEKLPTIVLDAGHGGFDGGAVGVDGIVEKDINLSVTQKLYDLFTISGFEVVLTRDSDKALDDAGLKTTRKRKNSDIHNRAALADQFPNAILISIHQNKFPKPQYYGAQVFYGPKNEKSAMFGKQMQDRMVSLLQPENTRLSKPCGDSVYLIYNAQMPALLVECGFLSNPEDAHKLITGEYQRRVAFAIFAGTMDYLGLTAEEMPVPETLPD